MGALRRLGAVALLVALSACATGAAQHKKYGWGGQPASGGGGGSSGTITTSAPLKGDGSGGNPATIDPTKLSAGLSIVTGVLTNTAPFGADTIIALNNSAAASVSAWEGISTLSTNTAGSEVSKYVVKLLRAGAQVTALDVRPTQILLADGLVSAPSHSFQNSLGSGMWWNNVLATLSFAINGTNYMTLTSTGLQIEAANAQPKLQWHADGANFIARTAGGGLQFTSGAGFTFNNQPLGFFGVAAASRQTVGANTNNIASSGTTGTFPDFTNGTTYATDYANLHAAVYQIALTVTQLSTAMRAYGLGQ